jgi:hypothetical protein
VVQEGVKNLHVCIFPTPSCTSFPSVRSNLTVQLLACNVHKHNACQDDWGVTRFDIQFHQKQPQNLDAVMINQWLFLYANSHLVLCHYSPKLIHTFGQVFLTVAGTPLSLQILTDFVNCLPKNSFNQQKRAQ